MTKKQVAFTGRDFKVMLIDEWGAIIVRDDEGDLYKIQAVESEIGGAPFMDITRLRPESVSVL